MLYDSPEEGAAFRSEHKAFSADTEADQTVNPQRAFKENKASHWHVKMYSYIYWSAD